jgi:hypothetical protein
VLVNALMEIDPRFPKVSKQRREALLEVREELKAQAPKGAAPDPFEQRLRAGGAGKEASADGKPAEETTSR